LPMIASCDEHQLILRLKAGDREAFETLLDLYEEKVYDVARRMVGAQDAEDVAQEALIEICRSVCGFGGRSKLGTWAYRVAMNVCLQHLRKRRPDNAAIEDDFLEPQSDPADDPAEEAVRREVAGRVDEAIEMLPDLHRSVVILHELRGMTYRECADALGCPVGTVKSRLSNAFSRMREMLREYAAEGEAVR
jgi:RNA polymerase sigma-70 factor, ECF subfamily